MQRTLDVYAGAVAEALGESRDAAQHALAGLWKRDAATWSGDPAVQQKIGDRLGWLDSPRLMRDAADRLLAFADRVRGDGISDVVLLGMGGSSLAPEVLRAIVGVQPGWPRFHMLDSTDPAAVLAASTEPRTTLYIVASKSGTTIEPNSMAAYFRTRLVEAGVQQWPSHFVAITDEGTELASRARADGYRELFINPSDIGGRYSALSFFGMVPAAVMGQNIRAIVESGLSMIEAADPARGPIAANPAARLGLALGASALSGRNKLTLIVPHVLEPFGLWIEQLIAESTGKHGTGIVPIAGEPQAKAYGSDRLFVRIGMANDPAPDLPAGDAPGVSIELGALEDLGGEFVRWEIATAIAGALLEINPFDEPNVQQAKDATRKLLAGFVETGVLPAAAPTETVDGISLTLSEAAESALGTPEASTFLQVIGPGDYFALLAYLGPDPAMASALRAFRANVLTRTGAATMFGYGPRYLHSTGQLHKGGPNTGAFLIVSAAPAQDVAIPSQPFSFGTLELAQALGDFASLESAGRRALHIHLPAPDVRLLNRAFDALLKGM